MILFEDNVIEILYNKFLSKNPYLIRFFNYDGEVYEMRASKNDLDNFQKILEKIVRESTTQP